MPDFPRLVTERLVLRAFVPDNGPAVERLAGAREVAEMTLTIPHPYPSGGGAAWIATHGDAWQRGEILSLAICERADEDAVVGAVGLVLAAAHRHAEIGYWIGRDWWGRGYATEAARAVVAYGFTELRLHRILGRHFTRNPASGRVLQKLGMRLEGTHRDAYLRFGRFEDAVVYGLLEGEWRHVR